MLPGCSFCPYHTCHPPTPSTATTHTPLHCHLCTLHDTCLYYLPTPLPAYPSHAFPSLGTLPHMGWLYTRIYLPFTPFTQFLATPLPWFITFATHTTATGPTTPTFCRCFPTRLPTPTGSTRHTHGLHAARTACYTTMPSPACSRLYLGYYLPAYHATCSCRTTHAPHHLPMPALRLLPDITAPTRRTFPSHTCARTFLPPPLPAFATAAHLPCLPPDIYSTRNCASAFVPCLAFCLSHRLL